MEHTNIHRQSFDSLMGSPVGSDTWISLQCKALGPPMIEPFQEEKKSVDDKGCKIPSYGLSSSGYDLRIDSKVLCMSKVDIVIDPANVDPEAFYQLNSFEDHTGSYVLVPPKSFILACSLETVRVPRTHMVIVQTKSTYARAGLMTLTTPLESGWEGQVTLEFFNSTDNYVKMYTKGGVVQMVFHRVYHVDKDYVERGGKYQHQTGVTHARA